MLTGAGSGPARVVVTVLVLSIVAVGPIGAVGSIQPAATTPGSAATRIGPGHLQVNDTPVRHERPDGIDAETDISDYSTYLARSLGQRLGRSLVRLREGEYTGARTAIGQPYRSLLRKYLAIADHETTPDEAVIHRFEETASQQRRFLSTVAEFYNVTREYRAAKQGGDVERARELAHRLGDLQSTIDRHGVVLSKSYGTLTNQTAADLSEETTDIDRVIGTTATRLATITSTEFEETTLTVESATTEISFREPLVVTGRVETVNDSGIPFATVGIELDNRTVTTEADRSGAFTFVYRPTILPLRTDNVTIEYFPDNSSRYGAATATAPVNVTPVNPSLSVTTPKSVRFNETLVITGHVGTAAFDAAGVPVAVRIGRERLGLARTNASGMFRIQRRFPARIPDGEYPVTAEVQLLNSAITGTATTTTIAVEPTPTDITLSGRQTTVRELLVRGRLTTDNGTPLGFETVTLMLDGRQLTTLRTDEFGRINETVTIPLASLPNRPGGVAMGELTLEYAGDGTNFRSTTEETTVPIEASLSQFIQVNWARMIAVGALLGGLFVLRLGYDRFTRPDPEPSATQTGGNDDWEQAPSVPTDATSLVGDARDRLAENRFDSAVQLAYTAVRTRLADELDIPSHRTHWEFYWACQDTSLNGRLQNIARLTLLYERAAFDHREMDPDPAQEAVETAATVVEG